MKKLQLKVFFGNIVKIGYKKFIYFDETAANYFVPISSSSNQEGNSILAKLIQKLKENNNSNSEKPSILATLLERFKENNNNGNNSSNTVNVPSTPGNGYNYKYHNLSSKLQRVYRYLYGQKSKFMTASTIDISSFSLNSIEARKVLLALIADKPEFYYMCTNRIGTGTISYNWSVTSKTIKLNRVKSNISQIESIADSVASQARRQPTNYAKIKYVHDWICNNMTYTITESISVDGFATGRGLCQSYAHMFHYIMNKLNIDCLTITGTANGGRHTWNHVKLDGKWYLVDVCFDDPSPSYHYQYFLKGKSALLTRSTTATFPTLSSSDY